MTASAIFCTGFVMTFAGALAVASFQEVSINTQSVDQALSHDD